jgi:sigma-E factor negative regulatory protein RseC
MIEETGHVVARRGAWAEVETTRRTSCGHCSVNGSCGVALLDRFLGRRSTRLTALNRIEADLGQRVVVGIPEETLLTAATAAYLVPVLALIGGSIVTGEMANGLAPEATELFSILGGAAGLFASLWWLSRFGRARRGDARYQAVVLRIDSAQRVDFSLLEPSSPDGSPRLEK